MSTPGHTMPGGTPRSPGRSRATSGTDSQVLKRLGEWEKQGVLPELLQFYRRLLCIQSEAGSLVHTAGSGPDREAIARTGRGEPLLRFDDLSIDWPLLADTFREIVDLIALYPGLFGDVPESLRELGANAGRLREATRSWFEGNPLPQVAGGGVPQALLELAIQAALRPFLTSDSKAVANAVGQEQWRRGYCPVCGGSPDFAFLDRENGARWLLCSRCDAEWLFQRLECPRCGNQDQHTLAYFTDDKGLYRLYVCERCRGYLKAIDLRCAGEVLLPLERYLTIHLDMQAHERGYGHSAGIPTKKGTGA